MANTHGYSIVPPSAVFGDAWPSSGNFTQGFRGALSVAGWTSGNIDGSKTTGLGNEGFPQQTFLGASLRQFNVNAGFGDSSSTMGVELVNDEYNRSDGTAAGLGDDVYHSGKYDNFNPPVVGSPVFFKFGKNHATVEQAFRKDFDQIYSTPTKRIDTLNVPADPFPLITTALPIKSRQPGHYLVERDNVAGTATWMDKSVLLDPTTKWRGFAHFTFGGILQSYTETRGSEGDPLYSVKLTDPREILSNTQLLLNNYAGTTFNNKNLYNIYGFLEYDTSDKLLEEFQTKASGVEILEKKVNKFGKVSYKGMDQYVFDNGGDPYVGIESLGETARVSGTFPITGQGFARRTENGIPFYRVSQALNSLFTYTSELPEEYKKSGFGGVIDFRGYNYVVDWGGIPSGEIPLTYYLDYDQMSMLDLAQELCDVLSRDLYVSLLPVIDHPSCAFLYKKNQEVLAEVEATTDIQQKKLLLGSGLTTGIIRIDSIDKKEQPKYGAVKKYLDDLESNDIYVENRDVGFEVSNVTTDRFVVGAQEVDMYYFNNLRDRDNYVQRLKDNGIDGQRLEQMNHDKWTLETNLNQQILPFYGFLGDNAVSIPRGFGSYQQILLDAKGLDAHGVGAYYVATEMELRAATVGYKTWSKFLQTYNELYVQELTESMTFYSQLTMNMTEEVAGLNDQLDENSPVKDQLDKLTAGNRNFGVSVPRSLWNSDANDDVKDWVGGPFEGKMDKHGYPANPCNPPFGYPLYYKRAEKIGIPECGIASVAQASTTVLSNIEALEDMERNDRQRFSYITSLANNSIKRLQALIAQKVKTLDNLPDSTPEDRKPIEDDIKILSDRINEIKDKLAQERDELNSLKGNRKVQIYELKETIKNSKGILKNLNRTARDHIKNAKKVYDFVKKIANDNLGKKYLVKIPRACNVNWSPKIKQVKDRAWDVTKGPYGFPLQPVNQDAQYEETDEWKEKLTEFKKVAKQAERKGPTTNDLDGSIWPSKSNAHWHYLDVDAMGQASAQLSAKHLTHYGSGYTYGALKCNYNPMTESWEHNYAPQPAGGFFNFALFDKTLSKREAKVAGLDDSKLPKATRQALAPKLLDKLITKGNRIQCYARYDHSQHYDMSKVGAKNLEQQAIGKNGDIIPDVMETLPNLHPDKKLALNEIEERLEDDRILSRQKDSVAFVKCTIDNRFYMAPKTVGGDATVWAEDFTVGLAPVPYEVVYVDAPEDSEYFGCKIPKVVKRRPVPLFGVKNGGLLTADGNSEVDKKDENGNSIPVDSNEPDAGNEKQPVSSENAHKVPWDDFDREYSETYNGWIIKTEEADLDPKHVYALITVPGRITPTQDKRYVDGPQKAINAHKQANFLTEDVVNIDEFKLPGIENPPDKGIDCNTLPSGVEFSFADISKAIQAQKDTVKSIGLSNNGDNSMLAFISPSPIYPDLVALPLMSLERCYGPWVSSALDMKMIDGTDIRFGDIGGKIEFIKDEKLAPWSFAGYQLMDEAAKMKTKFSNSLLLFTERGSFTYPTAPIEISLAKALKEKGPLVTSVSVDVGNESIKTSVQLDLYTSRFGKLQKQKEIAIAQISRERQKIIDENNRNLRRGLGKSAANMNIVGTFLEQGGQVLLDNAKESSDIITNLEMGETKKASDITISATNTPQQYDGSDGPISINSENSEGVVQTEGDVMEAASIFRTQLEFDDAMQRTAGGAIADIFKGASDNPFDPYFASRPYNNMAKRNRRNLG